MQSHEVSYSFICISSTIGMVFGSLFEDVPKIFSVLVMSSPVVTSIDVNWPRSTEENRGIVHVLFSVWAFLFDSALGRSRSRHISKLGLGHLYLNDLGRSSVFLPRHLPTLVCPSRCVTVSIHPRRRIAGMTHASIGGDNSVTILAIANVN